MAHGKGGLFSAGRDGYWHGTPDRFPEVKSFVNCRNTCLQVIDISITLALESGAPRLQPYRISRPCDLLTPAFHTSHSQLISLEIKRWFVVKGVFFGQLSRYRHGTPDAGLLQLIQWKLHRCFVVKGVFFWPVETDAGTELWTLSRGTVTCCNFQFQNIGTFCLTVHKTSMKMNGLSVTRQWLPFGPWGT